MVHNLFYDQRFVASTQKVVGYVLKISNQNAIFGKNTQIYKESQRKNSIEKQLSTSKRM